MWLAGQFAHVINRQCEIIWFLKTSFDGIVLQGGTDKPWPESVPIPTCLLQIPHWLSRVQTRPSVLRGAWLSVYIHEQFNCLLGFEGNDVSILQNSSFPTWRTSILKWLAERPRECASSDIHYMCSVFGARTGLIKRNWESSTIRKYVTSVFTTVVCSHAFRAAHRQYVPKYDKWVEIIFLSFKSTQITECSDAISSAVLWRND
jgi:hypothetical protein